jgi:hypothetical protein
MRTRALKNECSEMDRLFASFRGESKFRHNTLKRRFDTEESVYDNLEEEWGGKLKHQKLISRVSSLHWGLQGLLCLIQNALSCGDRGRQPRLHTDSSRQEPQDAIRRRPSCIGAGPPHYGTFNEGVDVPTLYEPENASYIDPRSESYT